MKHLYTAPFGDTDGPHALYVPASRRGTVANDPRVAPLLADGFRLIAVHGLCAALLPADLSRALAVLGEAGL